MTQEEANKLKESQNNELKKVGADKIVIYDTFAYWNATYEKQYRVIMYPSTYKTNYEIATDSQKLAFARVSRLSQIVPNQTFENFKIKFDENTNNDSELSSYLKK